jgi:TonB-dependent starch-binding outer membrane protein SusC
MLSKRFAHPLGPVMCVLALMLCSMTAHAQNARGRNITGTVLDADANPVANATVTVAGGGPSATTGADGSFRLAGVATTNVVLEITADGFTAKQVPVLGANTALQMSITIVKPVAAAPPPPPASETRMVGGVITDASRAPVAGATVRVQGTDIQAITAADGSFTLPGVGTAEVALEISAPNQPPTTVAVPADRAVVAVTMGAAGPAAPAAPATRTVTGKVVDPTSGEPIVAAQIQVVSTGAVIFTDADGSFVVEGVPPGPLRLDITAPERESRVLEVAADATTADVPLALSRGEQIVIEGRAPVIVKTNLANGASVIDDKELNRVSSQHLDAAMTAKVSGSNLQSNSGAPGGGAQLRLRGISTINGQASPLYVVDGVIISNVSIASGANAITAAAAGGNASNQDNPVNRLADLNPNDIETLEVLKGASAAALYGSKAANGVVVITTKRGRSGENRATITQRVGISQPSNKLGSRTFNSVDEVKAAFCSPRQTPEQCDASALVQAFNAAGGRTWDHEDEILRTPFSMETIASVSGGNQSGNYFGSALISDNPGVVIGTFYEKQSGRIAVGYNFGDKVRLGITANLIHSLSDRGLTNNDNTGTSNYVVLASTPSFVNLEAMNGVFPANPAIGSAANPIQTVSLLQNREDVWRLIGGATLGIDAYSSTDGTSKLRLLGNFGADNFQQKNTLLAPNELLFEPRTDGLAGTSIDATTSNTNWNAGAGAVWSYRPSSGAFRSALSGGVTLENVDTNSVYVIAQNLNAGQQNVTAGVVLGTNQNRLRTRDAGLYVQEELSLVDDQLSLLGGLLGERSSLNGDTGKYFIYPKVAAVYSVLKPGAQQAGLFAKLETLRLRAAFGEAGNRPNYGQKFTALNANNTIDGNPALVLLGIAGDPDIEPERQREFEVGTDVATKDQGLVFELTGYYRGISNLVLQRQVAPSTGFVTQFANGGSMRNLGVEAALQVRPLPNSKIDWTSRATFTLNRSKITDLEGLPSFDSPNAGFGAGLGAFRIEEGKSATQIVATFDPDDPNAVVAAGDGEPDFRIGWSNVVAAGDFTFSALLDWQQGSEAINLTRLLYDGASNSPDVEASGMRLTSFINGDPRPYIEDVSFVKLREVSVAYNLPKRLASQLGPIRNMQFSLSGRNLLTFTPYSGLDPEVSNFAAQPIGRNYDVAPYPPSRSFWLSVTAGL